MARQYEGVSSIAGPLVVVEGITDVAYDELIEIHSASGRRRGKVIEVSKDKAIVQVFEGTVGLNLKGVTVKFLGKPFELTMSESMLGRTFNALGEAIDGGPQIVSTVKKDVNGEPINPVAREYPRDCIQTGISAIDILMTLVRGQKLPVFSGNGLPHNELASQIARQANISGKGGNDKFAVIFATMGATHDTAEFFKRSFEESGAFGKVVMFLNLADDPSIERIIVPRSALTTAEYFAYELGYHVLVIMTDITNYCESLREISSYRGEVPSRKGYPGYLYSDLATLYERAGKIHGKNGSITQIPIMTMPNDDITHPVPDMTGYITEGQIVLSRSLLQKGVYPPINILPSLSRLMKDGIGEGRTRDDHQSVASQLNALYSKAQDVAALASVIGEDELNDNDRKILEFSRAYESRFVKQGQQENRSFIESLDLSWDLFKALPKDTLERLPDQLMEKYLPKGK
ncbi:MAG: V-type ATP synthase subunit B [Bdellovibrionales bacterium RIFOXYD1_FULL_53_11]|nr:MAG: V-type ATP synthase subunit B [Bdellovibrionales bacterium RIFOXYD1_FULL_53_11]